MTGEPPPETRVMLYRIAIEALANVQKHAGALSGAGAPGERRQGVAGVQIDDHGSGFTPNRNGSPPGHLGLTDMRERAEMAGGWWKLESHPGAGTSVAFWLPAVPEVTLPSPQALPAPI